MFKPDSVRVASNSKAKTLSVSPSQILRKDQWSKETIY